MMHAAGGEIRADDQFAAPCSFRAASDEETIMKMTCMSCKFFRLENPEGGFCREPGKASAPKTPVRGDEACGKWADCGQQYYIRLGWIKAYKARAAGQNKA